MNKMKDYRRSIKRIEKRYKQASCNHSAYKMLPIWGGLFGIGWECTQCGMITQDVTACR